MGLTFCYKVMSFGLKNVSATYQCLMDKIFTNMIGNIIVKSSLVEGHLEDLAKVFDHIRAHNMWLKPEKCFFGVGVGKTQINVKQ